MRALLVLTIAGGSVAHATLTPLVSIAGVTPDLPLIMVVLLALRRGPEFGSLSGFVTGLLLLPLFRPRTAKRRAK